MAVNPRSELEELRRLDALEQKARGVLTPQQIEEGKQRTLAQKDTFTDNLARGAKKRALGVAQATGITKLLPDEYEAAANDLAKQYQEESQAAGFNVGEILGDPLTYLPIPGNIGAATKGARALQAAAQGAKFGVIGGITDPLTEDQSRLGNAALQGATGAAFAGASQPLLDTASIYLRKLANAIFAPNTAKINQIDEAARLISDPEIAKHMKPTMQAVTDKPWVASTANVMENIPFVGNRFTETGRGYEKATQAILDDARLKGVVQPEDAGRAINNMIQRKEAIPLEQEIQDIAMQKARGAASLRNVVPSPQITEEQAGRSIAEGMNRRVGADVGLASRIRKDVIKAEQGVKVPVPDILALRSEIPLAGVDETLLKQAQAFLDKNAIWDEIQNKKYIDADTLYQLKGLIGKATTPKEATTGKYIYAMLKDAEGQMAIAADQQNKGAISSLVEKYGVNHTPEQIAQFEQQLYGRAPGTAAGTSVSQATNEFNQLFREGADYKKNLLNKFTKEPIEQAGREVYAQKPLESTFQAAHSALQKSPSLFDEVANSLTSPRQKSVFSANMVELAGGDIGNTDQWVKNYIKLPDRNRLSLVYGDKVLKSELDNLATRLSSIPEKPTLPTPLLNKFGNKSPEKIFATIASDLKGGGTELAQLRNSLTSQENLSVTDGLFKSYATDEHGISKIKWAKEFRGMTDEAKTAFANNDPRLAADLNKLADAIGNIEKVQGFDNVKGVGRFVAGGAIGTFSGLVALMTGIPIVGKGLLVGAAGGRGISKIMNDPDIVRSIAYYTKLAPTKLNGAKRMALQGINKSIMNSQYLSDSEKESLIKLNNGELNENDNPRNDNGIAPPVAPEREVPDLPLYNQKQEASANPAFDTAMNTVFKNEGGHTTEGTPTYLGIDSKWWPNEYKEAVQIGKTGGEEAAREYAKDFYKTHFWDKYDLDNVPPEVQEIVMDGAVNHRSVFVNRLIKAAKGGASRDALLKMREAEYKRIGGGNLEGWKNRIRSMKDEEYKVARR